MIDIHRQGEVAGAVRELEGYAHLLGDLCGEVILTKEQSHWLSNKANVLLNIKQFFKKYAVELTFYVFFCMFLL